MRLLVVVALCASFLFCLAHAGWAASEKSLSAQQQQQRQQQEQQTEGEDVRQVEFFLCKNFLKQQIFSTCAILFLHLLFISPTTSGFSTNFS